MKLLLIASLLLFSCSKEDPGAYCVQQFEHEPGGDVYHLVKTFTAEKVPDNFSENGKEIIFVVIDCN